MNHSKSEKSKTIIFLPKLPSNNKNSYQHSINRKKDLASLNFCPENFCTRVLNRNRRPVALTHCNFQKKNTYCEHNFPAKYNEGCNDDLVKKANIGKGLKSNIRAHNPQLKHKLLQKRLESILCKNTDKKFKGNCRHPNLIKPKSQKSTSLKATTQQLPTLQAKSITKNQK